MPEASLQALVQACLNDRAAAQPLSPHQWQVCHHIAQCRTAALGGFALACDACGERRCSTIRRPDFGEFTAAPVSIRGADACAGKPFLWRLVRRRVSARPGRLRRLPSGATAPS
ncbi:MAG: transposase zinc-binding domain-containing protein, partial [Thiohalocapsa sp.]